MGEFDIERQVILDQIQALNARSRLLRAKMEADPPQELTDDERRELAALTDRIQSLLGTLERLRQTAQQSGGGHG